MSKPAHIHPADVHGIARLAADATAAVTDIVEAMHLEIALPAFVRRRGGAVAGALAVPRLAYAGVRGAAQLVGGGVDLAFPALHRFFGPRPSTPERDTMLSVLSGVVGDHLAETGNPLAVPMQLRRRGLALELRKESLAAALPQASRRIVVMIHGLCGTDAQWKRAAFDYGAALEADFGFTPVYLRYNSGLHVSTNGRALAALLEDLVAAWPLPVDEVMLLGHSMGGLVARSAVHYGCVSAEQVATPAGRRRAAGHRVGAASSAWVQRVRRMAFLGTPHHGAPLERGGNWLEQVVGSIPMAAPLSRLGRLRSAGVTDLRHGNLLDEDWQGVDRFERTGDRRRIVPLPAGVDCLAVAATTGSGSGDTRDRLVADGLVPVSSALGRHRDPKRDLAFEASRRRVVERTSHMGLLGDARVYGFLGEWLSR